MNISVPAGYKLTDVGVIPEDWETISAADACSKIQDGTHFSPRISGNDYFYVTSKNIRFGYLDMSTASRIDAIQHRAIYRRCDVMFGDILLTKDGANTGNAALNTLTEEFSLLSSVAFLRFQQSKYSGAYFLQQILATQGQRQIQEAMAGNAITRLTLQKINKLRFPVPPNKTEQEAIAEALSDADALIESLEQLANKKRQLKQGAIQNLLTGKKRLPGYSGEWEVKRLGNVAPLQRGFDLPNPQLRQGIYPVVYSNGVLNHHVVFQVKGPGVVTGRSGTIGKVSFIKQDYWPHNTTLWVTNFKGNDPKFIFYLLTSIGLERFATGSGVPTLNRNDAHAYMVNIPPSESEQSGIATVLSDIDVEIAELEALLTKTRTLKQGMMHKLLTGKVRLI